MFKYLMALLALSLAPSMASATTIVQTAPNTTFSFSDRTSVFDGNYTAGSFTVDSINSNGIYSLGDLTSAKITSVQLYVLGANYALKDLTSFSAYVVGNTVKGLSLATKDCFEFSFGKIPSVTTPPVTAAVPEPATWAMMIMGFALVGVAMRSHSKNQVQFRRALV